MSRFTTKSLVALSVLGVAIVGVVGLTFIGGTDASLDATLANQRPPIPVLSAASFEEARAAGTWLIVEFGGATCIPCKAMQPTLQELQEDFGDVVKIRNFWIQDYPDTARNLGIMMMPTQIVFDPMGKEVLRHEGGYRIDDFRTALANIGLH